MSDLKKYTEERKKRDPEFAYGYDEGYEQFKIGMMIREARESAGLSQEELAKRLQTKKTAISRIENHAEDIKLSTLERVASSLGKRLKVSIVPIERHKSIAKPSSNIQVTGRRTYHPAKKRAKSVAYKKAGEKG
jgi:transcriptional regulator with XRE-family HTH domain